MAETTPSAPVRGRHAAETTSPSAMRALKKIFRGPGRHAAPAPATPVKAERTTARTASPALRRAVLTVAAAALPVGLGIGAPAHAETAVDGSGNRYYLTNDYSSSTSMGFGRDGDTTYVGDFQGHGRDTLAVRRGNVLQIAAGPGDARVVRTVAYGLATDKVLVGDWDGDGIDTLAVRRGNVFHFTNDPHGGASQFSIAFGRADDEIIVGDWNGDGRDTLGLRRGNVFMLASEMTSRADITFAYGNASDTVVVGDWDGDGRQSVGVHRGNVFHLRNSLSGGAANASIAFGRSGDTGFAGNWNGRPGDTIGVRRPTPPPPPVQRHADPAPQPPSNQYAVTGVWARLAQCESGGNPRIVSRNGLYYGLYQFSLPTWRSVGGTGLPSNASPEEQTMRAQMLQARAGWGQWPACARKLGLR